jgi:hypothetical protein
VAEVASIASQPGSAGATTIVVKGRNFYDISVLHVNGRPLDTTFVNIDDPWPFEGLQDLGHSWNRYVL